LATFEGTNKIIIKKIPSERAKQAESNGIFNIFVGTKIYFKKLFLKFTRDKTSLVR
jgi:hypothetical protein